MKSLQAVYLMQTEWTLTSAKVYTLKDERNDVKKYSIRKWKND